MLLRLFAASSLLGHLVFFALRRDFRLTEYLTWNYIALTLALLLALTCSLLDLLQDRPHHQDNETPINTNLHNLVGDVERQSSTPAPPTSHPKFLSLLTRITVPVYQLAVSATVFGATAFWAVVYTNATIPLNYALLAQAVAAPLFALTDFFVSFRMNFRLVYILPYLAYNAAYVVAAYTLTERAYLFIFLRRDASTSSFAAKAAGLASACVLTAVVFYFLTSLRSLRSSKSLPAAISAKSKSRILADRADSASATSSNHSDLSQLGLRRVPTNSFGDGIQFVDVENEDKLDRSASSTAPDRASVPIHLGGGGSGRSSWLRVSSARLTTSLSNHSRGEGRPGFSRNSSTNSMWEAMQSPTPKKETEVFQMPSCYTYTTGNENELVRLPMPRAPSSRTIPTTSRSTSGQFSRNNSANSTRQQGPAPSLPSSALTASMLARNGSMLSNDRRSWRHSRTGDR